jgi:hypothetical protein
MVVSPSFGANSGPVAKTVRVPTETVRFVLSDAVLCGLNRANATKPPCGGDQRSGLRSAR